MMLLELSFLLIGLHYKLNVASAAILHHVKHYASKVAHLLVREVYGLGGDFEF